VVGGEWFLDLEPTPEMLRHGAVRASVVAFLVDGVVGIAIDRDPTHWSLTSDLSIRMRAMEAPPRLTASGCVLRRGRRTVSCAAEVHTAGGLLAASGLLGFSSYPRRPGDPPKPEVTLEYLEEVMGARGGLRAPLREEAGVRSVDPGAGIAEMDVTAGVKNPAGTLQGAMVALLAESAAEDLAEARAQRPMLVTELDIRYLEKVDQGPVRTRVTSIGEEPGAPMRVELTDTRTGTLTSVAHARAVPA
jgi:acyl-coenzyme A thioesterase PaaI-like protein